MEFKENVITAKKYHELRSSVEWVDFNVEQTAQELSRSLYSLAVFDAENPVGMGRTVGDGIYNIVCDVVLNPEHQGKGIGTEIISRLLNYLKKKTPESGRTSILMIAEKGKETFYEKFGLRTFEATVYNQKPVIDNLGIVHFPHCDSKYTKVFLNVEDMDHTGGSFFLGNSDSVDYKYNIDFSSTHLVADVDRRKDHQ